MFQISDLHEADILKALTASATAETRQDILESLGITKDNLDVWVEPCNRKNLFYEVRFLCPEPGPEPKADDYRYCIVARMMETYRQKTKLCCGSRNTDRTSSLGMLNTGSLRAASRGLYTVGDEPR